MVFAALSIFTMIINIPDKLGQYEVGISKLNIK